MQSHILKTSKPCTCIYIFMITRGKKAQLCISFTFHTCAWILHLLLSWKDINELVKSLSSMNRRQWLQITIFVFWRVSSTSNCGPEMDRFVETPPPPSSHSRVVFIPHAGSPNEFYCPISPVCVVICLTSAGQISIYSNKLMSPTFLVMMGVYCFTCPAGKL